MSNAAIRLVREGERPQPMRFNFTVKQLDLLAATDSRRWVYDTKAEGLAMQITPSGQKTFYVTRRMQGRYRKVRIGNFRSARGQAISIEQARKEAVRLAGQIAEGRNPADDRRSARAAMTFDQLFKLYLEQHAKVRKRSWREDQRQYEKHLKRWAGRRLDAISKADVQRLHASVGKSAPTSANRLVALTGTLYAVAADHGYQGDNPARGIKRFPEQTRDRFLGGDELPRFLAAVDEDVSDTARDWIRVALFTGARRGNVCSMRWDEADFQRKLWTIPGEKAKNGEPIDLPLVPAVMQIIRQRKADPKRHREYVFQSRITIGATPYFSDPIPAVKRVCKAAKIRSFRPHDIRRTLASWMTAQGVPYPVVMKALGHKAPGVTAIYTRVDLASVREAFEKTVAAMLTACK